MWHGHGQAAVAGMALTMQNASSSDNSGAALGLGGTWGRDTVNLQRKALENRANYKPLSATQVLRAIAFVIISIPLARTSYWKEDPLLPWCLVSSFSKYQHGALQWQCFKSLPRNIPEEEREAPRSRISTNFVLCGLAGVLASFSVNRIRVTRLPQTWPNATLQESWEPGGIICNAYVPASSGENQ